MKSLDIEMRTENHPLQSGICAFLETPIWKMCFSERKTRAHAEFSPKKHIFPNEDTTTGQSRIVFRANNLTYKRERRSPVLFRIDHTRDELSGHRNRTNRHDCRIIAPLSQGRLLNRAHKLLLSMDARLCIDALDVGQTVFSEITRSSAI